MRWVRIAKYALVLFAATSLAAFPIGFAEGFLGATAGARAVREAAPLFSALTILAAGAASVAVLAVLSFRTPERALAHVGLVALLGWLVSLPINVLIFGQPVGRWALDGAFLAVWALAGLGAGAGLRRLTHRRG